MKLKSLAALGELPDYSSPHSPPAPKFHRDILRFGEAHNTALFTRKMLLKEFPDAITEITYSSDKGYRLLIEIIFGKSERYVDFLRLNNLLERSMRAEIEEVRNIARKKT